MGNQTLGNFNVIEKLQKGLYGKTRLCQTVDSYFYAVKIIEMHPNKQKGVVMKQLKFYFNFQNKGILTPKDFIDLDDNKFGIITQYCQQGNLSKHLSRYQCGKATIEMKRIAHLVEFLHIQQKIPHRNIKPQNILFKNENIFLVDLIPFTFTTSLRLRNTIGCFDYLARETFQGVYSFSQDIWSLGIVFLEIYFGKKIRQLQNLQNIEKPSTNKQIYPSPSLLSQIENEQLQQLITKMLIINPQQRVTISQVIKYLDDINTQKVKTYRNMALNKSQEKASNKYVQQLNFSFDHKSQYFRHFVVSNSLVKRKDDENIRYQIVSKESIPSGKWQISLKVLDYGKNNDEIVIGLISQQRKKERMSGDIDQANSIAFWSNFKNKKGNLCINGEWKPQGFPFIEPVKGLFSVIVDTNERNIQWYINDQLITSSYMPQSYWDHQIYIFVGLMGQNCTINFKNNGTFM